MAIGLIFSPYCLISSRSCIAFFVLYSLRSKSGCLYSFHMLSISFTVLFVTIPFSVTFHFFTHWLPATKTSPAIHFSRSHSLINIISLLIFLTACLVLASDWGTDFAILFIILSRSCFSDFFSASHASIFSHISFNFSNADGDCFFTADIISLCLTADIQLVPSHHHIRDHIAGHTRGTADNKAAHIAPPTNQDNAHQGAQVYAFSIGVISLIASSLSPMSGIIFDIRSFIFLLFGLLIFAIMLSILSLISHFLDLSLYSMFSTT